MLQAQKRNQKFSRKRNLSMYKCNGSKKNNPLRRLSTVINLDIKSLIISAHKTRLNLWCKFNGNTVNGNQVRNIFHKFNIQSYLVFQIREYFQKTGFCRDVKANLVYQVDRQLFYTIDPKLKISEETCRNLTL